MRLKASVRLAAADTVSGWAWASQGSSSKTASSFFIGDDGANKRLASSSTLTENAEMIKASSRAWRSWPACTAS